MAALVSSHSALLVDVSREATPGGILLNSRSFSAPLTPNQREHRQLSPLASSSSSASHTPEPHSRSSTFGDASARKIRFAPLPDPRARADYQDVFYRDDSDTDSLTQTQLPRHASTPANYSPVPPSPSAHSLTDNELHSDDPTSRDKGGKQKSKRWGQKLLRPLLHPLLPASSSKCEDGSPSIFRIPSKDSTKASGNADPSDEGFKGGTPLGRRMSTGCQDVTYQKETEQSQAFRDGAPLMPVFSENGGSNGKGRKDGQRMLNGRVYGRRASSVDRERRANKRNQLAYEPEFVEWGYGGMGSVNNEHTRGRATSDGPDWAKLQSRGKVLGEREDADPEGDDGSGMGWVRKRREQRERQKREQEEREKNHQEQDVPEIEVHAPEPRHETSGQGLARRSESTDRKSKEEEHHIYRAISVPAPHPHHVRHHSYHKNGDASGTVTPTSAPALSRVNSASSVPFTRTSSLGSQGEALLPPIEKESPIDSGSSVKSAASTTSSESLNDEEEDGDEDTERESDEDDGDEESRITSLGAGVEKVSRHKE